MRILTQTTRGGGRGKRGRNPNPRAAVASIRFDVGCFIEIGRSVGRFCSQRGRWAERAIKAHQAQNFEMLHYGGVGETVNLSSHGGSTA